MRRLSFYQGMSSRLRTGGYLINTEISFDLDSKEFPSMLRNWESIQSLMGATPESLATLPKMLREALTVLPPQNIEKLLMVELGRAAFFAQTAPRRMAEPGSVTLLPSGND